MERVRDVLFYKAYFFEFFNEQSEKVKEKIDEVLFLVSVSDRIPSKFFKHIEGTNGLYEIRLTLGSNIFRIFCCFDEGKVIVLFNGFQKKSQKTPAAQIVKALKIKDEYFEVRVNNENHENKRPKK